MEIEEKDCVVEIKGSWRKLSERIPCEFHLIRYVPDTVKNEFVNIGVLLREAADARLSYVRFTRDWSRVKCMDPDVDTGLLEALEAEIQQRLNVENSDNKTSGAMMRTLEESFSNGLQMSEGRGCLAESVALELEELMRMYVEPVRERIARQRSGRAAIALEMRNTFERAGVWRLMRKRIAASEYTRAGDPLKIDCGYRNGVVKMFHAVSLDGDVETAKGLAFSAPRLSDGVLRVENAKLELTAIIEPIASMGEDTELYRFGVEILEQQSIRVLTVNDLARVAETARRELRV
jgi:hypothetical protein